MNKKTKEKVLSVIQNVIIEKITELVEGMSDNEFVEEVGSRVYDEIGYDVNEKDEVDELTELIGERVLPLLHKILEYGIECEE
jgi:hypothetical protein